MVNINIQIPDDLHKQLRMVALEQDITLKEYVVKVLESQPKRKNL